MIHKQCRDLIELSLDMARKTEYPEIAKSNLDRVAGMLNYALSCGHISPIEHASELITIDLIRTQRENSART